MNKKTAKALERSIEKWERNAVVIDLDDAKIGWKDCPLCALFLDGRCADCPVAIRTKDIVCAGSPYREAMSALDDCDVAGFRTAARKEVEFLKSLREVKP